MLLSLATIILSTAAAANAAGFPYGNTVLNDAESFLYTSSWSATYKQHNPTLPNGRDTVRFFASTTDFKYEVGFVTSNKNLVAIHSLITNTTTGAETVAFDIFRLDAGTIVEHWDVLQSIPTGATVSGNPVIDPAERSTYNCDGADEARGAALVAKALPQLFGNKSVVVEDYLQDPYVQHNPTAASGVAAFKKNLAALGNTTIAYEVGFVLAKCDIVVAHSRVTASPGASASIVADVFRVKAGKLVEHWDVVQTETPAAQTVSGNPMFAADEASLVADIDQTQYGPVGKYATTGAATAPSSTANGTLYVSSASSRSSMMPFAFLRSFWL
ncbi:hypothetical protein DFJ73DRAFT_905689 [Zopfochytrium polystomum]|nr:hypothetical protein DFJ73DRAFT_905689 [Zopfochytrium polystomum]